MDSYIFVIASAISVFAIVACFKVNVEKIKEDPEQRNRSVSNFFIGVAISEIIPIILVIYGIINLQGRVHQTDESITPAILVIILMVFAAIFILLQRSVGTHENSKEAVHSLSIIAIGFSNSIPIVSLVFLFAPVA